VKLLHDQTIRESTRARIQALSHNASPEWGKMSVGQMLWHCNQVLGTSLNDIQVIPRRPPFPVPLLKFMLFNLPWPHGAPTAPEYKSDLPRDFEAERGRCLGLIDRFTARHPEHHTRQQSSGRRSELLREPSAPARDEMVVPDIDFVECGANRGHDLRVAVTKIEHTTIAMTVPVPLLGVSVLEPRTVARAHHNSESERMERGNLPAVHVPCERGLGCCDRGVRLSCCHNRIMPGTVARSRRTFRP
jgi:hypothetical protein